MKVLAIACISKNGGLGKGNDLLGHIPEDLSYFKVKTEGRSIFMGSNTARSLPNGAPLPNRENYVLCRESEVEEFELKGFRCLVEDSVRSALKKLESMMIEELMIIGGAFIYKETIQYLDKLYINVGYSLPLDADCFFSKIRSTEDISGLGLSITSHTEVETASHGRLAMYVLER